MKIITQTTDERISLKTVDPGVAIVMIDRDKSVYAMVVENNHMTDPPRNETVPVVILETGEIKTFPSDTLVEPLSKAKFYPYGIE